MTKPVEIVDSSFAAIGVAAGYEHTCVINAERRVRCIGFVYVGVGYASVTLEAPVNGRATSASGGSITLWPGATALVPITSSIFAGLDARYVAVLGVDHDASASGLTFGATG